MAAGAATGTEAFLPRRRLMNPTHISEIIRALKDVLGMMLDLTVEIGKPELRTDILETYDASAIIGLSGDCVGSVALSFSNDTAAAMVSRFVGTSITPEDPDFTDGLGELANMVTGSAKANFGEQNILISCPSVIVGTGHRVFQQKDMPTVQIPVSSESGSFVVFFAIEPAKAGSAKAAG